MEIVRVLPVIGVGAVAILLIWWGVMKAAFDLKEPVQRLVSSAVVAVVLSVVYGGIVFSLGALEASDPVYNPSSVHTGGEKAEDGTVLVDPEGYQLSVLEQDPCRHVENSHDPAVLHDYKPPGLPAADTVRITCELVERRAIPEVGVARLFAAFVAGSALLSITAVGFLVYGINPKTDTSGTRGPGVGFAVANVVIILAILLFVLRASSLVWLWLTIIPLLLLVFLLSVFLYSIHDCYHEDAPLADQVRHLTTCQLVVRYSIWLLSLNLSLAMALSTFIMKGFSATGYNDGLVLRSPFAEERIALGIFTDDDITIIATLVGLFLGVMVFVVSSPALWGVGRDISDFKRGLPDPPLKAAKAGTPAQPGTEAEKLIWRIETSKKLGVGVGPAQQLEGMIAGLAPALSAMVVGLLA